ncbi:MAG: hypothetical protein ABRQ38_12530 [Candidatus Eremiobacterota bacterium]
MSSVCLRHQDRTAVSRCKLCLKPVCEECKMETAEGIFCSEECKKKAEAQKSTAIQTEIQIMLDRQKQQKGILKNLFGYVTVLIGLSVAGYIAWQYLLPPSLKMQIKLLMGNLLNK